jgi:hypothetical protein
VQLQEVATNAVAAKAYGIDPEADKDAALDAFAKFNVLLFPSAGMLARLQHVDTLEGSAALTVEYLAAAASGKPLLRGDIPVEPELAPVAVREDVPPPVPAVPASPGAQERDSRLQSKMTAEQLQALQVWFSRHGCNGAWIVTILCTSRLYGRCEPRKRPFLPSLRRRLSALQQPRRQQFQRLAFPNLQRLRASPCHYQNQ